MLAWPPASGSQSDPAPGPITPGAATAPRPILDEATLAREYRDYLASIRGLHLYQVRYIRLADEAAARDWIARLRSGADFADVARHHSTHPDSAGLGGDLGTHASCRWARATLEILDALKPGQIHPQPVKGTHGWGIYRLESRAAVQPRSYARYREELLSGRFVPECPWSPPVTVGVSK